MTITIVNSAGNKEVWRLYNEARIAGDFEKSIGKNNVKKKWYEFGPGKIDIDQLRVPLRMNSLEDAIDGHTSPDDACKNNCQYFNYVYNNCVSYLKQNQNRYWWGRANLQVINHPKSFAMILLAHLCEDGAKATGEKQQKYRARIENFVSSLLNEEFITSSSSDDAAYLSTQTVLNRIAEYEERSTDTPSNVDELKQQLSMVLREADKTHRNVDNFLLPLLTGEQNYNIQQINELRINDSRDHLEKKPLNHLVVKALFPLVTDVENRFEHYHNGHGYDIKALTNSSFLIGNFNEKQQNNLRCLLTSRDKLAVLKNQLTLQYDLLNQNENSCSVLTDIINHTLKAIEINQQQLDYHVKQFNRGLRIVYSKRAEGIFDRKFEQIYINKMRKNKLFTSIERLGCVVCNAIGLVPRNLFDSYEKKIHQVGKVFSNAQALFNINVDKQSQIIKPIEKAQDIEIERQTGYLLYKIEELIQQCEFLIDQARGTDRQDDIPGLARFKESLCQLLRMGIKAEDRDELEDWVMIEETIKDIAVSEKAPSNSWGMLNLFNFNSNQLQKKQEQLDAMITELEEKEALIMVQQDEISRLVAENKELTQQVATQKADISNQKTDLDEVNQQNVLLISREKVNRQLVKLLQPMSQLDLSPTAVSQLLIRLPNQQNLDKEALDQLHKILENTNKILQFSQDTVDAYCVHARRKDKSLFFSHNNNGRQHARARMSEWQGNGLRSINVSLYALMKNSELTAQTIEKFGQDLQGHLSDLARGLITSERESSHKKHSFRHYERTFYETLFNNQTLNLSGDISTLERHDILDTVDTRENYSRTNWLEFKSGLGR